MTPTPAAPVSREAVFKGVLRMLLFARHFTEVRLAEVIATCAHAGQVDKAGRPYITHPERVAAGLNDPTAKAVAWLHDVIEDTSLNAQDLLDMGVSADVVDAVVLLTRVRGVPETDYYDAIAASPLARQVKLADIVDNTNPGRLALLDAATQERLRAKYGRAVNYISHATLRHARRAPR